MRIRGYSGFTLLEMLITVTVLAILVAIGLPSFRTMIDRNAVTATANNLLSTLLLARSEAIKREVNTVVAKDGSDWSSWQAYADADKDGTFKKPPDEMLIKQSAGKPTITPKGAIGTQLTYNSRGRSNISLGSSDYFEISKGKCAYKVAFNSTGRPRVEAVQCP